MNLNDILAGTVMALTFGVLCTICIGLWPSSSDRRDNICFTLILVQLSLAIIICIVAIALGLR